MSPSTPTEPRRHGRPDADPRVGLATGRATRRRGAARAACRRWLADRGRRLAADESGMALVEFALVGSLLLMLVLGVIEYGNVFSGVHTLTSLSREGANLAARGSSLPEVVDNVMVNGSDIGLSTRGGTVATRIAFRGGAATVEEQEASPGFEGKSRMGAEGEPAQSVQSWGLQEGQTVHVVEIYYRYDTVTPLRSVVGISVPDTLYERGIF